MPRKWTLSTEVPDRSPATVEVGEAVEAEDGTLRIHIFSGLLTLRPIVGKPQLETEVDLPQFMSEIRRAHAVKTLKFLGVSFFVNRWKGTGLSNNREYRRTCLDLAVKQGLIEIYDAPTREPGIYDQAIRILEIP
jgi:hypothetical protein